MEIKADEQAGMFQIWFYRMCHLNVGQPLHIPVKLSTLIFNYHHHCSLLQH